MTDDKFTSIGITGNIGSGKSYVSKIISLFQIPVFDCDMEAKALYSDCNELKRIMVGRYGDDIYGKDGNIDKGKLSEIIFQNKDELTFINSIVHPMVEKKCIDWMYDMKSCGYSKVLVECAIMFETNIHRIVDKIILVDASDEIRIQRAMKRDGSTYEKVISRMQRQLSHEELKNKSDFLIDNSGENLLLPQITLILESP